MGCSTTGGDDRICAAIVEYTRMLHSNHFGGGKKQASCHGRLSGVLRFLMLLKNSTIFLNSPVKNEVNDGAIKEKLLRKPPNAERGKR